MTDIRRTLLWVVFSASLFLIWDAWNKHNGQPSFFGPPPARGRRAGDRPGVERRPADAGRPCRAGPAAAGARRRAAPRRSVGRRAGGGRARPTITTDVVKATLDSRPAAPWCGSSC